MENEKLSQSYIQKYDALSDSFIVVERDKVQIENINKTFKSRKFEPFSFFKIKNRHSNTLQSDEGFENLQNSTQQPIQNQPLEPSLQNPHHSRPSVPNPPPPKPQPVPPANTPVILSRDAYNKLKILNSLYRSLAISDPVNVDIYNTLANETIILQTSILSIYQLLSGNNFVPAQNQISPSFTGNLCKDILTTENYVQDIIDLSIALQRSVNISDIDRQLSIIIATLLSQRNKLSTLRSNCAVVNNEQ